MARPTVIYDAANQKWLRFQEPLQVIEAHHIDEVLPKLHLVEKIVQENSMYAAGFIGYEAAPAFDPALRTRPSTAFPLLWFGIHPKPDELDRAPFEGGTSNLSLNWTPSITRDKYDQALDQIKEHLAQGDTYQVNYTFRLHTPFSHDPWDLFIELMGSQQTQYAAFIDTDKFALCSASPELFFTLMEDRLSSRPMKGTAPRGMTLGEDNDQARWLYNSEKNRAENIMIVDMIRNDMGRISVAGSVRVPKLFSIERYPTVWQMTTTVTAKTHASVTEILTALFPCSSITGAPKPSTMQIIANLETTPRHVYTGCIGFMAPGRTVQFNVAIRTVLIDKTLQRAEYGVGGGITWDSDTSEEYEECNIKAKVLTEKRPDFSLLESLLWTPEDKYFLLDYHLRRLQDTAVYFQFPVDINRVKKRLSALEESLPAIPHKVRLLVSKQGDISCESMSLDDTALPNPLRLRLSRTSHDSQNPFLYHKTTNRQVYDAARNACPDCDDVILHNQLGEVTESSIANIVVKLDGELLTPPIKSGLLPGTFRAHLLEQGKIQERVIKTSMLEQSEEIYLINSVRKWCKAYLET